MKSTHIPIPSTLVKIGNIWMLFDSAFNMPRMRHIGENPKDWGITSTGTLWLRCYAKHVQGEQYKFQYFERADGSQKFIVEHCFGKSRKERVPHNNVMFDVVRKYLSDCARKTKKRIEKRKLRTTVYCNKSRKEKET